MAQHKIGQMGGDLVKAGQKVAQIPSKNVMAMARVTRAEIIKQQPKRFKQLTNKDIGIKRPRQKYGKAFSFVAGSGLAVLSEWGSYQKPYGWTIFPKAYTVAGGRNKVGVTYVGRARIEHAKHTLERMAKGDRVRLSHRDRARVQNMVLAFGAPNASKFAGYAKHKPIKEGNFVGHAIELASRRSGELVNEQVGKVVRSIV